MWHVDENTIYTRKHIHKNIVQYVCVWEANYMLDFICRQTERWRWLAWIRTHVYFSSYLYSTFFSLEWILEGARSRHMAFQFLDNLPVIFHSTVFPVVLVVKQWHFFVSVQQRFSAKLNRKRNKIEIENKLSLKTNSSNIPCIFHLLWIYCQYQSQSHIEIFNLQAQQIEQSENVFTHSLEVFIVNRLDCVHNKIIDRSLGKLGLWDVRINISKWLVCVCVVLWIDTEPHQSRRIQSCHVM